MKKIHIFIASANELKQEREQITLAIERKNKRFMELLDVYFDVDIWEWESAAIPPSLHSQDTYNEIVKQADLFVMMIKNRVGKYTQDEYTTAEKQLTSTHKPRIVIYKFPTFGDDPSRAKFIKYLRTGKRDIFSVNVENIHHLLNELDSELDRLLPSPEKAKEASQAIKAVEETKATGARAVQAQQLFEEGKYKEAQELLNPTEIDNDVQNANTQLDELSRQYILKAKIALTFVNDLGRFAQAEQYFERAIAICRSAYNLHEYALYLYNQNKFNEAEPYYIESLVKYRKLAEVDPERYEPNIAATLNNLGNLHRTIKNFESAEKEYNEALKIKRQLAAKNPDSYEPDIASTLNNLGCLHDDIKDYPSAEKEYNEALEIYRRFAEKNLATYEPNVAITLNNLAVLHRKSEDYPLAEKEYNEALKLYRKLADKNPDAYEPDVAMTLNNLGYLHYNTGDKKMAEKEWLEALEIYERFAKTNPQAFNPKVKTVRRNLARLSKNTTTV